MKPAKQALLIFLRYPEPGRVKSRLAADIGAAEAARVYERLTRRTLGVAADFQRQHCDVDLFLFYTPSEKKFQIAEAFPGPWGFVSQQGDHLGARMGGAVQQVLSQGYSQVLLVGTDLADLEASDFTDAFEAVAKGYAALGPTADGGFYLIGLNRPCPMAFQPETWGTSDIFNRTQDLLTSSGFRVQRLAERKDVDRLEDLASLKEQAWFNATLSIIIPTVKPLAELGPSLRHLRQQIWPGDEIIIIKAARIDECHPIRTRPRTLIPHHIKRYALYTRHARKACPRRLEAGSGHPGFSFGFPQKPFPTSMRQGACRDDIPGSWALHSPELCLEITPQIRCTAAPRGRGHQLNRGAELAEGNLLFFLHDDSVPPPNFAYAIRKLCARPETSLGCFSLAFSPSQPLLNGIARWANLRTKVFGLPYGDQGLFCRREMFDKVGGFKKLYLMEDVDFVRSCRRFGRILMLPDSIATSPERYLRKGTLRASLQNHLTMLLYHLGVSDRRLYSFYYRTGQPKVQTASGGPSVGAEFPW